MIGLKMGASPNTDGTNLRNGHLTCSSLDLV
jgi:hypothetical protein